MPLLENDVIFAYLNRADSYHDVARKLFYKLKNEELTVEISSVSLLEMELVYKSRGIENRLLKDTAELIALPGAKYVPLTPKIVLLSAYLRKQYNLTFFDSHYAATALSLDRKIISFDRAYERVKGLARIDPKNIV